MKNNQSGFGIVGVLLVVVVIGLISISGWFVWKSQAKDTDMQPATSKSATAQEDKNKNVEQYTVPVGFRLYENADIGFKFAYPEGWGQLKGVNDGTSSFAFETDEMEMGSDSIGGKMEVRAAKLEVFVHQAIYHGASVRPSEAGGEYKWLVVDVGQQSDYSPGGMLDPQPEVIFQRGNVQVYDFPSGHACGLWHSFAFATNKYFVGIKLPYICPDGVSQEEADRLYNDYKESLIKQIAETVRVLD